MVNVNDVEKLTDAEKRQVSMFGCTIAQMREAVDEGLAFSLAPRAVYAASLAMSLMSDTQEEIVQTRLGDARQTLNRAKWILSNYLLQETA